MKLFIPAIFASFSIPALAHAPITCQEVSDSEHPLKVFVSFPAPGRAAVTWVRNELVPVTRNVPFTHQILETNPPQDSYAMELGLGKRLSIKLGASVETNGRLRLGPDEFYEMQCQLQVQQQSEAQVDTLEDFPAYAEGDINCKVAADSEIALEVSVTLPAPRGYYAGETGDPLRRLGACIALSPDDL